MKKIILITLILISLGLAVYLTQSRSDSPGVKLLDNENQDSVSSTNSNSSDTSKASDSSSTNDNSSSVSGQYLSYSKDLVESANPDTKIVLFFNASWCPTCQALNKDINQNLSQIPADVLILSVDYDKSGELKKQYGIIVQHTLVQVSNTGDEKQKWGGSPDLNDILKRI